MFVSGVKFVFLCFSFRFSVSNDLKYDAERDLKDVDAPNIPVFALNKVQGCSY